MQKKAVWFLSSGGKANTMNGDGVLAEVSPATDNPDVFNYDPMNPVPSYGGNVRCTGNAITAGAYDRDLEQQFPSLRS